MVIKDKAKKATKSLIESNKVDVKVNKKKKKSTNLIIILFIK